MQDATPSLANAGVTEALADFIVTMTPETVSDATYTWARHALLDWCAVTLAARNDDAVQILSAELAGDPPPAGSAHATVIGQGRTARPLDAALINGAASHALDYDDVNPLLGGHPSVVTMPVALALGERDARSGREVLAAVVAGFEIGCAIGAMTCQSHYEKGFHNTATIGTFAAAATACKLLGLDEAQTRIALGLAASQAAGLKCNFGTMTKPFHAGMAAQNGLRAALLAQRGFTARADAIEAAQGFAETQVPILDPAQWTSPLDDLADGRQASFGIERTLFKYHAACYGTHGVLDAINTLRRTHAVTLDDVETVVLTVNARARGQCDQAEPDSGLAMKFSLQHLAVAALDGADTAALETYCVASVTNPRLAMARRGVTVVFEDDRDRFTAAVALTLRDGRTISAESDVGQPATDLQAQAAKLTAKFDALAGPIIGLDRADAAKAAIAELDTAGDVSDLLAAVA